ncbi:unnamed protein product [Candidula unifasciata]|uniref:Uncharacterized protein n=1 Tax=Candidula unifasciata TaxID=100452 RepID=A0A8S3ZXM5_9EUPU|nr:unnamed protein product [Candidula unifasciata]
MATQTYVTDLQVMNSTAVQNGTVVKTSAANAQGGGQQGQKTTTIIQPAQAHTGQQFIVTSKLLLYNCQIIVFYKHYLSSLVCSYPYLCLPCFFFGPSVRKLISGGQ